MKNFFKILGKFILWIVLGIFVILGILLIIIGTKGLNYCFEKNNNKYCYNLTININIKNILNDNILPDGKIVEGIREFNYLNGFRNGLQTYYYKNGNIGLKCYYKDLKEDGELIGYYKNGQIMGNVNYIDGKENGKYTTYYKNGNIKEEGNYENGEKFGIWTGYYEDGDISYSYDYDSGEFIYNSENYDSSNLEKQKFIDLLINEIYYE